MNKTVKTLPFSGFTRAQVTPAAVEEGRRQARAKGLVQFGFRAAKGEPYHTVIATEGGTLRNPTGARGDNDADDDLLG